MDHYARLQLVGKLTYYLGWIALFCGGLAHLNIAVRLFDAMSLSQRNLFEVSAICFLSCIASELRARNSARVEQLHLVKEQAAA